MSITKSDEWLAQAYSRAFNLRLDAILATEVDYLSATYGEGTDKHTLCMGVIEGSMHSRTAGMAIRKGISRADYIDMAATVYDLRKAEGTTGGERP